jgi:hypothetical protein
MTILSLLAKSNTPIKAEQPDRAKEKCPMTLHLLVRFGILQAGNNQ